MPLTREQEAQIAPICRMIEEACANQSNHVAMNLLGDARALFQHTNETMVMEGFCVLAVAQNLVICAGNRYMVSMLNSHITAFLSKIREAVEAPSRPAASA